MKALLLLLAAALVSVSAMAQLPPPTKNDPLIGSEWNFLGVKKQRINGFTFLDDGRVKCDKSYKNARWQRLDDNNILFCYGMGDAYIVFNTTDKSRRFYSGFHPSGRARFIQRLK